MLKHGQLCNEKYWFDCHLATVIVYFTIRNMNRACSPAGTELELLNEPAPYWFTFNYRVIIRLLLVQFQIFKCFSRLKCICKLITTCAPH